MEKSDFMDKLGTKIEFRTGDKSTSLELIEIKDLKPLSEEARTELNSRSHMVNAGIKVRKNPFSLIFLGPANNTLPATTYQATCGGLGELELFISAYYSDPKGIYYHATFS
ncbi:MAG: hypothetical protein HKP58_13280 [Desulfatitalea sp.]|nr:hypothetical protein [Desulfatitalea sp.]NNK01372.1 hypothetical protein [Desulfatitalea sp.]